MDDIDVFLDNIHKSTILANDGNMKTEYPEQRLAVVC